MASARDITRAADQRIDSMDDFMGILRPGNSGYGDYVQQNAAEWFNRMGNSRKTLLQSGFCLSLGRKMMKIASVGSEGAPDVGPNGKYRLTLFMVIPAFEHRHLANANLTDAERQEAALDLHRFVRGFADGKIPEKTVRRVLSSVTTSNNPMKVKASFSDARVKAFVQKARKHADTANIPREDYEVSLAAELTNVIDRIASSTNAN